MTDRAEIERLLNQTGRTLEEIKRTVIHCDEHASCVDCPEDDKGYCDQSVVIHYARELIEHLEAERDATLAKVPRWISVEERLPYAQETVLFCHMIGKNARSVRTGYRSAFTPGRFYTLSGSGTDTVTHWMPLPEPPKEDA